MRQRNNLNRPPDTDSRDPCGDAHTGPRLLTYGQAAKELQVSARTVWSLVDDGRLRAVRFGHTVRIDRVDLEAFIETAKDKKTVSCDDSRRIHNDPLLAVSPRNKVVDATHLDSVPEGGDR